MTRLDKLPSGYQSQEPKAKPKAKAKVKVLEGMGMSARQYPDGGSSFMLPYPPSNNQFRRFYCTKRVNPRTGAHILATLKTEEAKAFIEEVAWLCQEANVKPLSGLVSVAVTVYRPRKSGDIDNVLKVLLDALNGYAYDDDKQIVFLSVQRKDSPESPGVYVSVLPCKEPGKPEEAEGKE